MCSTSFARRGLQPRTDRRRGPHHHLPRAGRERASRLSREVEGIFQNEKRIRHLKGKDAPDVRRQRRRGQIDGRLHAVPLPTSVPTPPHNHTDQEEIYIFTKGNGSMEVYADEETKTFVRSVNEGDAVTIPILNYHPVFSQKKRILSHSVHRGQPLLGLR